MPPWVGYAAMGTGLVPLLALAWLHVRGARRGAMWWWLAVAFGVSFAADVAGAFGYGRLLSQTYPLLQAGIFTAVLVPRAWTTGIVGLFAVASAVSLVTRRGEGLDLLLHVVGWLTVSVVAWARVPDGWLRVTLAVGFACLAWAWCAFVGWPNFGTWGAMQAVRLAMAVGFVVAVRTEGR